VPDRSGHHRARDQAFDQLVGKARVAARIAAQIHDQGAPSLDPCQRGPELFGTPGARDVERA
jgi:hypothetical protein